MLHCEKEARKEVWLLMSGLWTGSFSQHSLIKEDHLAHGWQTEGCVRTSQASLLQMRNPGSLYRLWYRALNLHFSNFPKVFWSRRSPPPLPGHTWRNVLLLFFLGTSVNWPSDWIRVNSDPSTHPSSIQHLSLDTSHLSHEALCWDYRNICQLRTGSISAAFNT